MFTKTVKRWLVALLAVMLLGTSFVGAIAFADDAPAKGTEISPIALYEFKDSKNLGKDSMGKYNLTLTTRGENAGITMVTGGGVHFDGNSILFAKNETGLNSLMSQKSLTIVAKFIPDSSNAGNSGIVGFGRNGWDREGLAFRTNGDGTFLRIAGTNPGDGQDQDWCPEVGKMATDSATFVAASLDLGVAANIYAKGTNMAASAEGSYLRYTKAVSDSYKVIGSDGRFCIGGQYRGMWINNEGATFEVDAVECFTGTVYEVRLYDFALSEQQITAVWDGESIYDYSKVTSATQLDLTSKVTVDANDTDAAILAAVNVKSDYKKVTVSLKDTETGRTSEKTGNVTWNTVVKENGKVFVEAPIEFTTNPDNVKARAEVAVGNFDLIKALAKYEFLDAENPGKDSMGNFDLVKYGNGTITVANGEATFDGQAALAAATEFADISEYLDSFTLLFDIKKSNATNAYWETPIGFGFKNGVGQWNTFHFAENSQRLRYTVSSKLVDGYSDIDGHDNMYWGHDIADCNSKDYDQVALTIQKGGKLCVYFNGNLVDAKVFNVPSDYSMVSDELKFAIGGLVNNDGFGNGFAGSLRNVAIYDFAMDANQVYMAQNGGYVKTNTLTAESVTVSKIGEASFEDDEVTSGTLLDSMTESEMLAKLNKATVTVSLSNKQAKKVAVAFNKIVEEEGTYYAVATVPAGVGYPMTLDYVTVKQELEVEKAYEVIVVAPENGTITASKSGFVQAGCKIVVTATAAEGYVLKSLTVNDVALIAVDGEYSFTLTEDAEVKAEFVAPLTVTLVENELGTLTATQTLVIPGEQVTVTVTPNEGFEIVKVLVNGQEATANEDGTYTFTVDSNTTVSAEFQKALTDAQKGCFGGLESVACMTLCMAIACIVVALKRKHA